METFDNFGRSPRDGFLKVTHDLFREVYDDLRRAAGRQLSAEPAGISLTSTALVHEAFLKLGPDFEWNSPAHLYRATAQVMRHILIDAVRCRRALKRGGDARRDPRDLELLAAEEQAVDPLEMNEALQRLQQLSPQAAQVVDLRYYAGMKWREIAAAMQISEDQAASLWNYARAKLRCLLEDSPPS